LYRTPSPNQKRLQQHDVSEEKLRKQSFEMYKLICGIPAFSKATLHFCDYLGFFQVPLLVVS